MKNVQKLIALLLSLLLTLSCLVGCTVEPVGDPTDSDADDKPTQSSGEDDPAVDPTDTDPTQSSGDISAKSDGDDKPTDPVDDPTQSSGDDDPRIPDKKNPSVTLDTKSLSLAKGTESKLSATVIDSELAVVWTVEDTSVVSLTENGDGSVTVKGLAVGQTVVKVALSDNSVSESCTVTVIDDTVGVSGITVEKAVSLTVGQVGYMLNAVVTPNDAFDKSVMWTSGNEAVVAVNEKGELKPVAVGETDITVTTLDGSYAAVCHVTVKGVDVTDLTLNASSLSLVVGATRTLTATVIPNDATDKTVTWTSSDTSVLTVVNGTVKTLKAGVATVTASSVNGKTASCQITVTSATISMTGVKLDKTALTLNVGENATLTPVFTPTNATNKNVSWSSSDEKVATVSENGVVTAVGVGSAKITVTTQDGNKTHSCTVTVNESFVSVTGVSLSSSFKVLTKSGDSFNLAATVSPSNASDKSVTWSSDNQHVAKVNASGQVSIVGEGAATVTVSTKDGGYTASCLVMVTYEATAVKSLNLSASSQDIKVGESFDLSATVSPSGASTSVLWMSDDTSVVQVSATGKVTAVGEGTATVTAMSYNGKKATCTVTATKDVVGIPNMDSTETYYQLFVGNSNSFHSSGYTWESSDPSVVSVTQDGTFTALTPGESWLTMSNGDAYARMKFVVYDTPTGIRPNSATAGCLVGDTTTFPVEFVYADGANEIPVIYTVSDPSVCVIGADGTILGLKAGTTTVTANIYGYKLTNNTVQVTVSAAPSVKADNKTFTLGETALETSSRLGNPVQLLSYTLQNENGATVVATDCVYHKNYRNLVVLSFVNNRLCGVFATDSGFSYTVAGSTLSFGDVLADSSRYAPDGYEQTTKTEVSKGKYEEEISRGCYLTLGVSQSAFAQRVFVDVLNEYSSLIEYMEKNKKGLLDTWNVKNDNKMTVQGVWIATNSYRDMIEQTSDTDYAAMELFIVTNAWRAQNGLSVLTYHADVAAVGESHCVDMCKNSYFAHINKKSQDPFARIKAAGISYAAAGENLAMGQTTAFEAFYGLLNSSGHRDNLTAKNYTHLGTGACNNPLGGTGDKRTYYAQEFLYLK